MPLNVHGRPLAALLLCLAALSLVLPSRAPAAAGCHAADSLPGDASRAALGRATLCLVNRERRQRGLRALRVNKRLALAARRHAKDMVRHSYFSHDSRSGAKFSSRIVRAGYLRGSVSWWVGENLAWGGGAKSAPRLVVRAWMNSPAHRDNLLDPRFREIGVGVVPGAPVAGPFRSEATYVHDFGFRA